MLDLEELHAAVAQHKAVTRVVVAEVKGSTPRAPGTAMLIWDIGQSGTIGGGALEFETARLARDMLQHQTQTKVVPIPLGPTMGQCCGGAVTVVLEYFDANTLRRIASTAGIWQRKVTDTKNSAPAPAATTQLQQGWLSEPLKSAPHPIMIYGAGHVGRALAPLLARLPDTLVQVFDPRTDQAALLEKGLSCITSLAWEDAAASAPPWASHFIMTPEHDADLLLCHTLLQRADTGTIGLIGSTTKWARFRKRLTALGHDRATLTRITCPIGDPKLGKHPQAIAIGVAAALLTQKAKIRTPETA